MEKGAIFTIYLPLNPNAEYRTNGDESTNDKALRRIKVNFCHVVGGYTSTIGQGGWVNARLELVEEPVETIVCQCTEKQAASLAAMVPGWIKVLRQEELRYSIQKAMLGVVSQA